MGNFLGPKNIANAEGKYYLQYKKCYTFTLMTQIGQKTLGDDEEGVEEERGTIERVEEIEEEQVDVDELEF